jgi:hypothetical protein
MPYVDRLKVINEIEGLRGSKVICYLTGMRPNGQAQISQDNVRVFFEHLSLLPDVPDIDFIRAEIEHIRGQVAKQRKEILSLQRAGVSTASAELLLERMLAKIDTLCAERDRVKAEQPAHNRGKVLGGRKW